MRLRLDPDRCTGHGRCYDLAPELFEPDEDGRGTVIGDDGIPTGLEALARRAVTNCPERAISIEDER